MSAPTPVDNRTVVEVYSWSGHLSHKRTPGKRSRDGFVNECKTANVLIALALVTCFQLATARRKQRGTDDGTLALWRSGPHLRLNAASQARGQAAHPRPSNPPPP